MWLAVGFVYMVYIIVGLAVIYGKMRPANIVNGSFDLPAMVLALLFWPFARTVLKD